MGADDEKTIAHKLAQMDPFRLVAGPARRALVIMRLRMNYYYDYNYRPPKVAWSWPCPEMPSARPSDFRDLGRVARSKVENALNRRRLD